MITQTTALDTSQLQSVSLRELKQAADLQHRVDRKYILTQEAVLLMVDALATRVAALEEGGLRSFGYESVYFDTPDLDCYLSAAHRRRRRFKVRTRSYLDTSTTMLEVKTRGPRGTTVKRRREHLFNQRALLDPETHGFINDTTGRLGMAATLAPVLTTEYQRVTLLDLDDIARLTIDADLRCTDYKNDQIWLRDQYVVETKSAGPPSAADRWLWSSGIRPVKVSKFGTGLAALNPDLPANKWHRTINRYFTPAAG